MPKDNINRPEVSAVANLQQYLIVAATGKRNSHSFFGPVGPQANMVDIGPEPSRQSQLIIGS